MNEFLLLEVVIVYLVICYRRPTTKTSDQNEQSSHPTLKQEE